MVLSIASSSMHIGDSKNLQNCGTGGKYSQHTTAIWWPGGGTTTRDTTS
jgi:hypothetical protein